LVGEVAIFGQLEAGLKEPGDVGFLATVEEFENIIVRKHNLHLLVFF
jgi:hypothetical protein